MSNRAPLRYTGLPGQNRHVDSESHHARCAILWRHLERYVTPSVKEVTQLLNQWAGGDQGAGEKVLPLVYAELRRIARRSIKRRGPSHTLQTTAVVHEAYVRLVGVSDRRWDSRTHFFWFAAKAVRTIW